MLSSPRLFVVIPCAGIGARAGAALPKQYRTVGGHSLLYHALAAFDSCSELTQTLVVLSPDDNHFDPRRFGGLRFAVRRCGGESRHISVLNGLYALSDFGARDVDWVLVHDAARAGVTPALIRRLIAAVRDDPVGGIMALPLADTLKRAASVDASVENSQDAPVRIAVTEPREGLWLAQTPQMFRLGQLRSALESAQRDGFKVTDEASALERLGLSPRLVRGELSNFKVTYPEDFALIEAILAQRAKQ